MSERINDGGAAFPSVVMKPITMGGVTMEHEDVLIPGMSLRAWIATHILQGLISNPRSTDDDGLVHVGGGGRSTPISAALKYADSLIAELEKK
jgi:hypothetical protein